MEFTIETMDRYMYVVFQCQGAEVMMDDMVSRLENVKEILRVSKFRIQYIADPPASSMECLLTNYQNYKKNKNKKQIVTKSKCMLEHCHRRYNCVVNWICI